MKKILTILASTLILAGCNNLEDYKTKSVPYTCEGIASGIELVVRYENKLSDEQLKVVKRIRDNVAPICTKETMPTTTEVAQTILENNAKHLTALIREYFDKEEH